MSNLARIPPRQKERSLRGTPAEKRYYSWLHRECVCCLTLQPEFDIAHTGTLLDGKGMGRKAALWTCLPLTRKLHIAEERGRARFWENVGHNPTVWAARLYDIFEDQGDPKPLLWDMHENANLQYISELLS